MAFETPITIATAINHIEKNEYLLPAIQREFVWSPKKIEWLFDSLMKKYPISSFLFWKVEKETIQDYKFYKFINEYRQRYKTHNDEYQSNGNDSFFAILDGQQRLTSLYIGLKGSYAYKEYRKKWENSETSIPTKHLYLNISRKLENEEDGREFDFKFLNKSDTKLSRLYVDDNQHQWFRVGEILDFNDEKFDDFIDEIDNKESKKILRRLKKVIVEDRIINYFLEEEQDLNKALNIFIRVNSGGEPLNFSDLIMSIAIANWEKEDARKEINHLVDLIQDKGFSISKDLILKTFLFLHSKDIKFKVTNFSKENAKEFEKNWNKIRDTISETFDLLRSFGFNDYSLSSKNAIIPVVYYLYHRNIFRDFSSKKKFEKDRNIIKKWLHTVLIKQVFGSSSDTTLSQIRQTFTDDVISNPLKEDFSTFPTEFKRIKNMNVDEEFIEELLYKQKEDKYTFSILSLLYPHLDYKNNNFHKDHLHAESNFSKLSKKDKDKYTFEDYNSIYNLQLLDSNENQSKQNMPLDEWVESQTDKNTRNQFLKSHLIPNINLSIKNFDQFFEMRKKVLIKKLFELLN